MKHIFLLLLSSAIFFGCKSVDRSEKMDLQEALDTTTSVMPEPFKMGLGTELLNKRVDLFRAQELGPPKFIFIPTTKNVEYGCIGLHLGNGLFVDQHTNLGIDWIIFFDIDLEKTDINITYIYKRGSFVPKQDSAFGLIKKSGNIIESYLDYEDTNFDDEPIRVVEFNGDTLNITRNIILSYNSSVITSPDSLMFIGSWDEENYTLVKKDETSYTIPSWIGNIDFEMQSKDTLIIGPLLLIRTKDEIQICEADPEVLDNGNFEVKSHLIIKNDGFIIYDEYQQGYHMRRVNNIISLYKNDNLRARIVLKDKKIS